MVAISSVHVPGSEVPTLNLKSARKVYGGLLYENISTSSLLRQVSAVQLISKRRESRYLISLVLSK